MTYTPVARRRALAFLLLFLTCWTAGQLEIFALVDAASRSNTNAPTDGTPWTSMGQVNGSGGTYLGAGWVLTAAHVGAGNVIFGSTSYPSDGHSVQLTNTDGSVADLLMFRLASLPPLPKMPLATSAPVIASQVDMIGYGFVSGSAETNFGKYTGFYLSAAQLKSWGNNKISNLHYLEAVGDGIGTNVSFTTDFSAILQTSNEAQACPGDSGGGVFQKSGTTWQLVGMMYGIDFFPDQPSDACVYGETTYCADIATYRGQIQTIIAGTVPTLFISRAGTNVNVCWGDTGVTYKLLTNTNVASTNWTVISPALISTNSQFCAQLPATNTARYFRLQKQ